MKGILFAAVLLTLSVGVPAQNRLEAIQWFYDRGRKYDAFELKLFNGDRELFSSSHGDVIDSACAAFPNLSSYEPREVLRWEEKAGEKGARVRLFFLDDIFVSREIRTPLGEGAWESRQYDAGSGELRGLYRSAPAPEGGILHRWFDPVTGEEIRRILYGPREWAFLLFYGYDREGRVIREILLNREERAPVRETWTLYWEEETAPAQEGSGSEGVR